VERHVLFEDGVVARPDARGVLAPVRRVAEPHRVPDAVLLFEPVLLDGGPPRLLDALAFDAGLRGVERRLQPLDDDVRGLLQLGRRVADEGRSGQRRVVAVPAAGEFDDDRVALLERSIRPREVWRPGVIARRHQRDDRGVVAAVLIRPSINCS